MRTLKNLYWLLPSQPSSQPARTTYLPGNFCRGLKVGRSPVHSADLSLLTPGTTKERLTQSAQWKEERKLRVWEADRSHVRWWWSQNDGSNSAGIQGISVICFKSPRRELVKSEPEPRPLDPVSTMGKPQCWHLSLQPGFGILAPGTGIHLLDTHGTLPATLHSANVFIW